MLILVSADEFQWSFSLNQNIFPLSEPSEKLDLISKHKLCKSQVFLA